MTAGKSYNGYPANTNPKAIDVDPDFTAAGRRFPGGVKAGPVSVVLRYVIEQFDARVEEVDLFDPGDEWGYVYKKSANSAALLSCHSSGTAVDVNATRHPNGTKALATFTAGQVAEIKKILAEVDGVVKWLGEAKTPDPMHFEIAGTEAEVARVAGRLLSTVPPAPDPVPGGFLMALSDSEQEEMLARARGTGWPQDTPADQQHPLWQLAKWTLDEVAELRKEVAALAAKIDS